MGISKQNKGSVVLAGLMQLKPGDMQYKDAGLSIAINGCCLKVDSNKDTELLQRSLPHNDVARIICRMSLPEGELCTFMALTGETLAGPYVNGGYCI